MTESPEEALIEKAAEIMGWKKEVRLFQMCPHCNETFNEEEMYIPVNIYCKDWNPLESWDDCMQLVEKLRERGYSFELVHPQGMEACATFLKETVSGAKIYEGVHEDPKTAILTAATKIYG